MSQCRFILGEACLTLEGDADYTEAVHMWGLGVYGNSTASVFKQEIMLENKVLIQRASQVVLLVKNLPVQET